MKKRGASLIWAIVVSTVVFTISVTTSNFVIKESQMSMRMDESARAYAAAESGIEWGKYCIATANAACPDDAIPRSYSFNIDGSTFKVTFTRGVEDKIKSIGTSNKVNRELEYIIRSGGDPTLLGVNDDLSIAGSYVQQFDYWTDGSAMGSIGIGDASVAPTKAIYFEHYLDGSIQKMRLSALSGGTVRSSTDKGPANQVSVDTTKINGPYNYRVRIEYTRDLYAKMTVMLNNFSSPKESFTCISPIMIVDLRNFGIAPTDLIKFYYSEAPVVSAVGDGASYKFTTSNVYFDKMTTEGVSKKVPVVAIGTQTWMAKNLDIGTMLASGSTLPINNGFAEKWCYNNDPANCAVSGGLYSWDELMNYATIDGSQGICPANFHIPTSAEWTTLVDFYGGSTIAGTSLKASPFSGPMTGIKRNTDGTFVNNTTFGYYWTSTESTSYAGRRLLSSSSASVTGGNYDKLYGFAVRCIQN